MKNQATEGNAEKQLKWSRQTSASMYICISAIKHLFKVLQKALSRVFLKIQLTFRRLIERTRQRTNGRPLNVVMLILREVLKATISNNKTY